jgi:hypothetical protein
MKIRGLLLSTVILATTAFARPSVAASCEALWDFKIANSEIQAAQTIPPGRYRSLDGTMQQGMPEFCRVAVAAHPTSDSNIQFEVWMPTSGWNGKFIGLGNGGFSGSIRFNQLAELVKLGYAAASTDTGHYGSDGTFAYRHPEKIIDFGYRAVHIMTDQAKTIINAYYGRPQTRSYFTGCSQGGRQGLMEAQRFPEDYDGFIVGAPAHNWTAHYIAGHLYLAQVLYANGPNSILPDSVAPIVGKAVNEACDGLDGLKDGIVSTPKRCKLNPEALLCKPGQDPGSCLSPQQVAAVVGFYNGAGERVPKGYYPGFDFGGEAETWPNTLSSDVPYGGEHGSQGVPFFKFFVYDDPLWDIHSWTWTPENIAFVENKQVVPGQSIAQVFNAVNPDLTKFRARGGKIIHFHGYGDPDIPAQLSADYYDSVVAFESNAAGKGKAQQVVDDFYRLYLVPAMGHCGRGPGPTLNANGNFDVLLPLLDRWVEKGEAPEDIVAAKYKAANQPEAVSTISTAFILSSVARLRASLAQH